MALENRLISLRLPGKSADFLRDIYTFVPQTSIKQYLVVPVPTAVLESISSIFQRP
eukprot:SAG11_NODE_160_length_14023_cov_23.003017_12_plen_56_part_00